MPRRSPSFVEHLRIAVESSGLGRNELAKLIGMDKAQLSRFMAGKGFLSEHSLNRLAAALNLRVTQETAQNPKARK